MKVKMFAALYLVVVFPLVGSAIAAGVEEPVQDGEEDGPLDGELEAATLQQLLDHMLAASQLPEPLEDQGRADVPNRDGRELALGMLGEHEDRASQAGFGDEPGVALGALLQLSGAPQRRAD